MAFKGFRTSIIIRLCFIILAITGMVYFALVQQQWPTTIFIGVILLFLIIDLFRFVEQTNKKLTRFLESVKYSDFSTAFTTDNKLGKTFKGLNEAFNQVMEAFRSTRAEKEEHLNYLHTVVQHVGTGLLSFDTNGNIELMNTFARRYLGVPRLNNIKKLKDQDQVLYDILINLRPGRKALYQKNQNIQLSISTTNLKLRGKAIKLISLQNIRSELQQKEIESWQNLTRVLRHEIMNSMTPIASLTSTLNAIIKEDFQQNNEGFMVLQDTKTDLEEGLTTISSRSEALIRFVDAYRDYTNIPAPTIKQIQVKSLLEHVVQLMKSELDHHQLDLKISLKPEGMTIRADVELLEMVLINLLKNALEAVSEIHPPRLEVMAFIDGEQHTIIQVSDNGPGILPEALERIFIPFYTTKKSGSGIGLALSRQIMQLHQGSLEVHSEPNVKTTFSMIF